MCMVLRFPQLMAISQVGAASVWQARSVDTVQPPTIVWFRRAARRGGTFHFEPRRARDIAMSTASSADLRARRPRVRAGRGRLADRHRWRALSRLHLRRRRERARSRAPEARRRARPRRPTRRSHVSNLFRVPEQEQLADRLCAAELCRSCVLRQFRRRGDGRRDQDRAQISTPSTGSPNAIASSRSKARSTAARLRRSRPAARRNTSKASARWSTASTRCRSATSRR